MKKKILVTGGAGYIGSKISYDLIDAGYDVIIVDNLSTGSKKLVHPKSIFFKNDLFELDKLKKKLSKYKNSILAVFHCAASLSVEESNMKPLKYYQNNIICSENILNLIGYLNIKKMIFSSSCSIYGNPKKIIVSEKSLKIPLSNYGRTKFFAEKLISEYSKLYNFNYAIYYRLIFAVRQSLIGKYNNFNERVQFHNTYDYWKENNIILISDYTKITFNNEDYIIRTSEETSVVDGLNYYLTNKTNVPVNLLLTFAP